MLSYHRELLLVTPVLQLGWVDIGLIDSGVIILTCVTSRREASTDALKVNDYYETLRLANNTPTSIWGEKQERRGEDDCPGYIPMYP